MAGERVVDEIITTFFLSTCQVHPQPGQNAADAALWCAWLAGQHLRKNREAELIPLTTGSAAEFYIEPMLPCIGDIDVMFYTDTTLAIPEGQKLLNLPDIHVFHNCITVAEIIDSHLPGYVYLKLRYILKLCNDGMYSAVEDHRQQYATNHPFSIDDMEIHGPAVMMSMKRKKQPVSVDIVHCVRCPVWPSQAADWPTRHRNYGWPDSATVHHVVSNGCDVVGVAHRQCRQDEWMGKHQWRLSFSRAEIVLINSWMPAQQIVYHILRIFSKTVGLTGTANNSGAERLSNYHFKTLMLWAYELKSRNWWIYDRRIVRVTLELMHLLAVWLTDARCTHYFIKNCNLINNPFDAKVIADWLLSIDRMQLSAWILNKYVRRCSQLSSGCSVLRLLNTSSTSTELLNALSLVADSRIKSLLYDSYIVLTTAQTLISHYISTFLTSVRSCACGMKELAKNDVRLSIYFTAVAFLHIAHKLSRTFDKQLMDILATVLCHDVITLRYLKRTHGVIACARTKAAKLMKSVASKSIHTLQLIETELSKAYLHTCLSSKDANRDPFYCLNNVYLAVLYYSTAQYKTAIDHFTLVTESQDHSQCCSHVVEGILLPKIDDDIDNVLGIAVLYQYVNAAALNQQQGMCDSVFTAELLAYYLLIKCRRFVQISANDEVFLRYRKQLIQKQQQPVIADILVSKLERKTCHKPVKPSCRPSMISQSAQDTSGLIELLRQSAVEHLTKYRQLEVRDFGSLVGIIPTDFQALYAFKRGDYRQCLKLSSRDIHVLLYPTEVPCFEICPWLIEFLDDDIVSVISLTLLVRDDPTPGVWYISQLTLLLYLMAQCQLKLHDSATSLALTLIYVNAARRKHPMQMTLERLILKLTGRKLTNYFDLLM